MAPHYVEESSEALDEDIRQQLLSAADTNPDKPWNLVREVAKSGEEEDKVRATLRALTLQGELTPTATGEIRVTVSSKLDQ